MIPFLQMMDMDAARIGHALRVLVVEDSYLTARALSKMLRDYGAEVIGPASSVAKAMELLDANTCDAAVLDINLGSETVEPVANRLDNAGCPFFFVSGYASPKMIDAKFKTRTMLAKPVDRATFWKTVADKFGTPPSAAVGHVPHGPS